MNFDLLFTILFILFFVVGPLLRRAGRQQGQPPPGRGTGPSGRQAGPPPPRPDTDTQGPLSERLEEARRRVLEAMGEETASAKRPEPGESKGGTVQGAGAPQGAGQPVVSGRRLQGAGRKLDWQEVVKPVESFMTTRPVRTALRSETGAVISAPPLRTERRRSARRAARLTAGPVITAGQAFGVDSASVLNGITWHEILSDPVCKRGTRRQTSRLRSR